MLNRSNLLFKIGIILFIIGLCFNSCTSSKKVIYFNDLTDSVSAEKIKIAKAGFENFIQKNDQLSIILGGSNANDLLILNSGSGVSSSASSISTAGNQGGGYLVEADGTIKLPYIGKIKVEGLTRIQLEATLTELFKDYTKNPIVNVRFLNYSFFVLGEVTNKGRFNMNSERTTILEALSIAGDLTTQGKRENIIVIREESGNRTIGHLNILSKDIFNSKYFYLKTNDLIYVEPVKAKFFGRNGIPQYFSIAAVGLSLLITYINLRK